MAGSLSQAKVTTKAPRGTPNNVEANINPSFDEETRILPFSNEEREFGDCGQVWEWDGSGFRPLTYKSMMDCKGVPPDDWPVLYRDRAERK